MERERQAIQQEIKEIQSVYSKVKGQKKQTLVSAMQKAISEITGIAQGAISIKATTTEQMGFVGRKEGLVAYATVLLETI